MKYFGWILCVTMHFLTTAFSYTCRISHFACHNNKCISPDRYCDGVDDCGDGSDEPRFCTVCNRTYYGNAGNTYLMILHKPTESKLPFLCHLTFTAYGHEFGDIVQLGFEDFHIGRLEPPSNPSNESCPDGYMQILELGRPFTGGSWCGKSNGLAMYYSESSTVTLTVRLFYTGRFASMHFEFRLCYKFIKKELADARFGSALAPIERGEIIPGTYCSRNYYECHRKKCQVQSPNYPGIYPRNVTCSYRVQQKAVPKCKHGMILVRQNNGHKMKLKRSADERNNTETGLKVWDSCDQSKDHIVFYDGPSPEDVVLLVFCGGDWLPPVLSRGSQMLVVFHSATQNIPLQSREVLPLLSGFELDVDTVFADSDSYDFSRHRLNCDFFINATESEMENGIAVKSKNRSGSISSPRHTLPPNTTCSYHFQGRTNDRVWLFIASYWHEPLLTVHSDLCPTRLQIRDSGGQMLGDHCNRPKICDHLALGLRNHSRFMRPCTADESYISTTNSVITQYYTKPGTAIHPSKFLIHYEFVNTVLGGRPWTNLEKEERVRFRLCSRLFKGMQSGTITSPKNVFMYARGGAKNLACLYRIEADQGERISLTLYNVSFGSNSKCLNNLDPYTDQYVCQHSEVDENRQSQLEITELPWRDVKIARSCFCDNSTLNKLSSSNGYSIEAAARILELRFKVFFINTSEDFFDVYFHAKFQLLRKSDCPRRQRIRGSGGEIQLVYPPEKRADIYCQGLPWLMEARDNHSLFILTWGRQQPLKATPEEQVKCPTKNRLLIYSGSPFKLIHVICPSHAYDSRQEIHVFSEDWHTNTQSDREIVLDKPPRFLLHFIGREAGSALLHWLEITRSRTSLHLRMESPETNVSMAASSSLNGKVNANSVFFDCLYQCPELSACINASLWCDGQRNCPSGYDELESHCDQRFKMIRNYIILSCILAIIFVLTVFVLLATIKRLRFSSSYLDNGMIPKRITSGTDKNMTLHKKNRKLKTTVSR